MAPPARQQAGRSTLKSLRVDRPATRLKSVNKSIVELAKQDPELNRLFERVTAQIIVTTAGRPRHEFKAINDPKKFARATSAAMLE